jgi:hypothetical protein
MNDEANDEYYIWSNEHRGWWGPAARGYFGLVGAGLYTRKQALEICRDAIPAASHIGCIDDIPVRKADIEEFLLGAMIPSAIMRR